MNDEEFEHEKTRVQTARDKWHDLIVPPDYEVNWEYWREPIENHPKAVMTCTPDWRYLQAHIDVCLPKVVDLGDAELEQIALHEMCHILVNEMRPEPSPGEEYMDHEERVVSTLVRRFHNIREEHDSELDQNVE